MTHASPPASRPSPLRCIRQLETLATLWIDLGLMLERHDAPRGGGSPSKGVVGSPPPLNLTVVDGRRRIEVLIETYVDELRRDPKWRPPAAVTAPALLLEFAQHIGRFTTLAAAPVAWAFAEDLDLALSHAKAAAYPASDLRVPTGQRCSSEGCEGQYVARLPETEDDADELSREQAFARSWPRAVCSADAAHTKFLDLRKVPETVNTSQLATWFGLKMHSVRARMRGAGVAPIGEVKPGGHVWDRRTALIVMTRQREG